MESFPTTIVYTTGALAVVGIAFSALALGLAARYKKDDKFCSYLFYMALVSNCVFLGAMAATSSRYEIEGYQSVHLNYGFCRMFNERTCNITGAIAYQGSSFFPVMVLVTFIFRSLMAVGYCYKPRLVFPIFFAVYLFTFPRFLAHVTAYNKTSDISRELSQRLNVAAKQTASYAIDLHSTEHLDVLYSFVPPFVLLACCFSGSYGYFKVCSDWETFSPRVRDIFNGFVTVSLFDCGLIAIPYFLFDWDLIATVFPILTQQNISCFKLPVLALPWAFQGLFCLIIIPFLRKGIVDLWQGWMDFCEAIENTLGHVESSTND